MALTAVAWITLGLGLVSAGAILIDLFGVGHRQDMRVMEAVWPLTALYAGPLAVWAYRRWGLPRSAQHRREHDLPDDGDGHDGRSAAALGTMHCGGGCTLGDLVGAWLVFGFAVSIGGRALWAEYVVDFALAYTFGIAFQYFAIEPMRHLGVARSLVAALKADTLSLLVYEVGMFGWMAVVQLLLFPAGLTPDHAAYWMLMQLGMLIGFVTALPVNGWLVRRGIKEAM